LLDSDMLPRRGGASGWGRWAGAGDSLCYIPR